MSARKTDKKLTRIFNKVIATIVCSKEGTPARLDRGHRRTSRAGRLGGLLARSAGVHVDFHADRYFDDLRCFPAHSLLPGSSNQDLSHPGSNLERHWTQHKASQIARQPYSVNGHQGRLSSDQKHSPHTAGRAARIGGNGQDLPRRRGFRRSQPREREDLGLGATLRDSPAQRRRSICIVERCLITRITIHVPTSHPQRRRIT